MKYVVSFTTSPTRIHKCQPMLKSILNQSRKPDLVLLNIPHVFARTGEPYNVPTNVSKHVHVNNLNTDYGPGTKIIPTIRFLRENDYDPNQTRVIYLDDDIKYPSEMIKMYDHVIPTTDNSVWTATGFNFLDLKIVGERRHGASAMIAEGYGGVCVKMNTFEDDFDQYIEKYMKDLDCRLSDDMILSNYYHKKHLSIRILNIREKYSIVDMWMNKCILEYGNEQDALHNGASGISDTNVKRYNKVIAKLGKEKERYLKLYFSRNGKIEIY